MFFDIGPLKLVALLLLAVIIFGPDKLPKLIRDGAAMLRKLRQFSDSAKEDIRQELGPQFKDFEFEDLNPRTFVRKNLLDGGSGTIGESLGLKEIRNGFDLREELAAVTDAAQETDRTVRGAAGGARDGDRATGADPLRTRGTEREQHLEPGERPPFDSDAT